MYLLAHYQNGELSDEFSKNLDACIAIDTKSDKKANVLVTVSNENAYDGYVSRNFPTDLKKKFIAIRKKDSSKVPITFYHRNISIDRHNFLANFRSNSSK